MEWMVFVSEQWLLVSIMFVLTVTLLVIESRKGGKSLNYHEATRLVNKGEAVILDVREKKDFSAGHIVDAIHIPYAKVTDRMSELEKHKSKVIVVVDKMGQHAAAATKTLREAGWQAQRLSGGMAEWQAQNLPVVK